MKHFFYMILAGTILQLPAKAAVCTDSLTPQALLDLNKMHLEIQDARAKMTDPIYLAALEATFAAKVSDISHTHQMTREQITSFLNSEEKITNKKMEQIAQEQLSAHDFELIKNALDQMAATKQNFASAFAMKMSHPNRFERELSIKPFLLLLKNAKIFEIAININEPLNNLPINGSKITLLHLAVLTENSPETVQAILDAGAHVDPRDADKNTPLSYAVIANNATLTELLLRNGANPDIDDLEASTILEMSSYGNNIEIAKLLLDAGADVNFNTEKSSTALFIAAADGHEEMVKFLLSRGADPTINKDLLDATRYRPIKDLLTRAIAEWNAKRGMQ